MTSFNTDLHGHAVKFSPVHETRLAVAAHDPESGGCLLIFSASPSSITKIASINTSHGLNDFAWSQLNRNVLIAADTNGSALVYDLNDPHFFNPTITLHEHSSSINCIDWNPIRRHYFLTAASTIKLWNINQRHSVQTFHHHISNVYSSMWNPHNSNVFASTGDCTLLIYDIREQGSIAEIGADSDSDVLSCSWCDYNDTCIATASRGKDCIRVWDIRSTVTPVIYLDIIPARVIETGSMHTVRKVKFSPHQETVIASCSDNAEVGLWNYTVKEGGLIKKYVHHAEPVLGLDMSKLEEGVMASTGLDGLLNVWKAHEAME